MEILHRVGDEYHKTISSIFSVLDLKNKVKFNGECKEAVKDVILTDNTCFGISYKKKGISYGEVKKAIMEELGMDDWCLCKVFNKIVEKGYLKEVPEIKGIIFESKDRNIQLMQKDIKLDYMSHVTNAYVTDSGIPHIVIPFTSNRIDLKYDKLDEKLIKSLNEKVNRENIPTFYGHSTNVGDIIGTPIHAWIGKEGKAWIEIKLDKDDPRAIALYKKAKNRMPIGASIRYIPRKVRFERKGNKIIRKLLDIDLLSIDLVGIPKNPDARISSMNINDSCMSNKIMKNITDYVLSFIDKENKEKGDYIMSNMSNMSNISNNISNNKEEIKEMSESPVKDINININVKTEEKGEKMADEESKGEEISSQQTQIALDDNKNAEKKDLEDQISILKAKIEDLEERCKKYEEELGRKEVKDLEEKIASLEEILELKNIEIKELEELVEPKEEETETEEVSTSDFEVMDISELKDLIRELIKEAEEKDITDTEEKDTTEAEEKDTTEAEEKDTNEAEDVSILLGKIKEELKSFITDTIKDLVIEKKAERKKAEGEVIAVGEGEKVKKLNLKTGDKVLYGKSLLEVLG